MVIKEENFPPLMYWPLSHIYTLVTRPSLGSYTRKVLKKKESDYFAVRRVVLKDGSLFVLDGRCCE